MRDQFLLLESGNEELLQRITLVNNGNDYQALVSETLECNGICDISNLKHSVCHDSTTNISSIKFSYDDLSNVNVDNCLTEKEYDEMSHLLQQENRKFAERVGVAKLQLVLCFFHLLLHLLWAGRQKHRRQRHIQYLR
jgi:hypothetical protein